MKALRRDHNNRCNLSLKSMSDRSSTAPYRNNTCNQLHVSRISSAENTNNAKIHRSPPRRSSFANAWNDIRPLLEESSADRDAPPSVPKRIRYTNKIANDQRKE